MLLEGEVNGGERMKEDIELHRPFCTSSGEKGSAPSSGGKRNRLKESTSGKKKRIQKSSLAMSQFSDFNTSLIDLVRSSLDSSSWQPRLPSAEELELELREKRARAMRRHWKSKTKLKSKCWTYKGCRWSSSNKILQY